MSNQSFKDRTLKALLWSSIETIGVQGINFVFAIILARILAPSDFGLMAMLFVFIMLSRAIIDGGFSQALIQKKIIDEKDRSSVFYFQLFITSLIYVVFYFSAPYIAQFFGEEQLTDLGRVIGITFFTHALVAVQTALLMKELDFRILAVRLIFTSMISGLVGVYLAMNSYGVWALVYKSVIHGILDVIVLWKLAQWTPKLIFSSSAIRKLFGFGSNLMFSSILNSIFKEAHKIVIGKFFTAGELGFYSKAKSFKDLPSNKINSILSKVLFPALSLIQDESERLKYYYKKSIAVSMFVVLLVMTLLSVQAETIIVFLLTDKWIQSAEYLQLMCFVGMFYPLHVQNLNILKVVGRSDVYLKLELVKKCLLVITIFIAINWGIMGLIYGQIVLSFTSYLLNATFSGRYISYYIWEQVKDLLPMLFVTLLLYLTLFYVDYLIQGIPLLLSIIIISSIGIIVYIGLSFIFKINGLLIIYNLAREKIKKSK